MQYNSVVSGFGQSVQLLVQLVKMFSETKWDSEIPFVH